MVRADWRHGQGLECWVTGRPPGRVGVRCAPKGSRKDDAIRNERLDHTLSVDREGEVGGMSGRSLYVDIVNGSTDQDLSVGSGHLGF